MYNTLVVSDLKTSFYIKKTIISHVERQFLAHLNMDYDCFFNI